MPKSEGYIIACAPAGVGALGGQLNDDKDSPFRFSNRNLLTGESDDFLYQGTTKTNGINLFGFGSTGHMIPVIKAVGDKIDLIAFQGYNTGASRNRKIMYDAYAYYGAQYNFVVAAGVHFPPEPWGPFYSYTNENIAALGEHIYGHYQGTERNDGIMIWQLLLENNNASAYSFLNVAAKTLRGVSQQLAIEQADDFQSAPYMGGVVGFGVTSEEGSRFLCGLEIYNPALQYPKAGTQIVFNCQIWQSKWWINPNEIPRENEGWKIIGPCKESEQCV